MEVLHTEHYLRNGTELSGLEVSAYLITPTGTGPIEREIPGPGRDNKKFTRFFR